MPNSQLYYTSLTSHGLEAVQKASFLNKPLNITHLAVGDGAGQSYEPHMDMKALKDEKYRGEINRIYRDKANPSLTIFEASIPATSGGYTIREAGLFDKEGKLFAIAKLADTVKPNQKEGEAKELYIRLIIEISNAANITFNMNSSAVFATHEWSHEHFTPISHISDFNNPHKVTAAQLGAATTTTVNNHINDKNNPHKTNLEQVILQDRDPSTTITRTGAYLRSVTVWLDCNNGHDNNDGKTAATPVKSIDKAISLGARAFRLNIFLLSDLTLSHLYNVGNIIFTLVGKNKDGSRQQRNLRATGEAVNKKSYQASFHFWQNAEVHLDGITTHTAWPNLTGVSFNCFFINTGTLFIIASFCSFLGNSSSNTIFHSNQFVGLTLHSCTYNNMDGNWVRHVPSGSSVASQKYVFCKYLSTL